MLHSDYQARQNLQSGQFDYYDIILTEHHLLNRPEQPCEEEEEYDFLSCVKTSQARRVGCRPPWDIWSPHTIPLCQTMDQLTEHEWIDFLFITYEKRKIVAETGCEAPCKYKVTF